MTINSNILTAHKNRDKADALVKTFFPLLPDAPVIPPSVYLELTQGTFSRKDICTAIQNLKPYKAPGVDGLQNIILQKCVDYIINYIYFIFWVILDFNKYPANWLIILTVVLHKPGKVVYNVAKASQLIGLLETLGKLF